MLCPTFKQKTLSVVLAAVLGLSLSGCIEDSDSSDDTTTIEGIAIVSGLIEGDVTVTDENGNVVASAKVNSGVFSLNIDNNALSEALTFEVTGSYTDSVSGDTITLDDINALTLTAPANTYQKGQKGNAPITAGSSIISYLIESGKTPEEANAAFKNNFGYEPDLTAKPFAPSALDSNAAQNRPQSDKDAAFRAGVFSQLAAELSLNEEEIGEFLRAIAKDLSDDKFDGKDDAEQPVTFGGQNLQTLNHHLTLDSRLLSAYSGFAASAKNTAGIPAPNADLPKLDYDEAGSSKSITTSLERKLTVTLDTQANNPIREGFWTSRVIHKISIKDDSNVPIDISNDTEITKISQHPNMRMLAGHTHSTPHAMMADTSASGEGTYTMDSYYVMPSESGAGATATPLGVWSYTVKLHEGEDKVHSVVFHPQVKLPLPEDNAAPADVLFSVINNESYQWTRMDGVTEVRPFRVWLQEVTANTDSSYSLSVFLSTRDLANPEMAEDSEDDHMHTHHKPQSRAMEDMSGHGDHGMMSFPAVFAGQKLHGPKNSSDMRPELTLHTVKVEVSVDGVWNEMQAHGETGIYGVDSVTLNNTEQNSVMFRVTLGDGSTDLQELKTNGDEYATLKFIAPTHTE